MKLRFLIFLLLVFVGKSQTFSSVWNIIHAGAVSDTSVLSTLAIQRAIDSCNFSGGGEVFIPSGTFKTGTIVLKSNVRLHFENGAILYGSKNIHDYQSIQPRFVALRTRKATKQLLYAEDAENISITGEGMIDGQGASFKKLENDEDEGTIRPHLIQFIHCKNVNINGIKLRNSGAWMQHYLACTGLKIEGIEVFNHSNYNNDGIDIDGCKKVLITNVLIDSDDDGICLKSTSDWGCENVVITNSIVSSHCNALKLGTESNTGFRNIVFSGIIVKPSEVSQHTFYGTAIGLSGISVEMVDGGNLEQIKFANIIINGTESPLFVRLGNRARPFREQQVIEQVGNLSDVSFDNIQITGSGKTGCSITGIPGHPVKGIKFTNISIESVGGGTLLDADRVIPELEKNYPESVMFGTLPAFGFFIRHAKEIRMQNIQFHVMNDSRPALYLEDVKDAHFQNFEIRNTTENQESVRVTNANQLTFLNCSVYNNINRFITLLGNNISDINIINNILYKCNQISYCNDSLVHIQITEQGNLIK